MHHFFAFIALLRAASISVMLFWITASNRVLFEIHSTLTRQARIHSCASALVFHFNSFRLLLKGVSKLKKKIMRNSRRLKSLPQYHSDNSLFLTSPCSVLFTLISLVGYFRLMYTNTHNLAALARVGCEHEAANVNCIMLILICF